MLIQRFLRQRSVRLTVAQISRRRPDQLRDLMTVLKLRAIDLDYGTRILKEGLGGCLYNAGFSGPRRPQEEKVSNRPAHRGQSRHVGLVSPHDLVNCIVLSNDETVELVLELLRRPSILGGI